MQKSHGFTLIEVIAVIILLGVLAVAAFPRFTSLSADAREAALQGVRSAVDTANGQLRVAVFVDGIRSKTCPNFTPAGRVVEVYLKGTPPGGNCNLAVSRNDPNIAVMIWGWLDNDDLVNSIVLSGDLQETSDTGSPFANTYLGYDLNGNGDVSDDSCHYHYQQPLLEGESAISEVISSGC